MIRWALPPSFFRHLQRYGYAVADDVLPEEFAHELKDNVIFPIVVGSFSSCVSLTLLLLTDP